MTGKLEDMLVRHEGLRLYPYEDSVGKVTIGIGRNLDDKGISKDEAYMMLRNDIAEVQVEAYTLSWYRHLNEARKLVIENMLFNIGMTRLLGFKRMIAAIERKDFERASDEMLDSKWAAQVGSRAIELARIMELGKI